MTLKRISFPCEFKIADDDAGTIEGLASTYGNRDLGGDIVMPGAFAHTLKSIKASAKPLPLLISHDARSIPAGKWTEFEDRPEGLLVRGKFFLDTQAGREARIAVKERVMTGLSIGYKTEESDYDSARKARLLKKVSLGEISVCVFPMNERAQVTAVKTGDQIKTERDFETFLRDVAKFSKTKARSVTLYGFKTGTNRWDADATGSAGLDEAFKGLAVRLNSKLGHFTNGTGNGRS